ncbi:MULTISPECIES: alpha/beta hydrolase [unclassified Enterococcus]|jgi:acetyl esterase|uniref:alpha/beta hydrolase n=1 Tax=unclassified Enterococcus TaxID=2608891 RepID=UPI003D2DB183
MKWVKRILLTLISLIVILVLGIFLINQLTPKPVSYLVRTQFDTSDKKQVYPRPKDFDQKINMLSVSENQKYPSKYDNNVLDIYTPKDLKQKSAVLFWMHGGGYVGGDKRDCQDYLKLLSADTNTIVVNINYTLAPETAHPAPVQQLNEAIKFMKEHDTDKIDWSKVMIGGDSAGAQIASEYLTALYDEQIQKMDQITPVIYGEQVQKFISLSGLLEPEKFTEVSDSISSFLYKQCGWAYFNDKQFTESKEIAQLSLHSQVKNFDQSFFFTDGNENTFTKQMMDVSKKLTAAGRRVTTVSYDKETATLGHEYQFDFKIPQTQETYNKLTAFLKE